VWGEGDLTLALGNCARSNALPEQLEWPSPRKQGIKRLADQSASERDRWLAKAAFFHNEDLRYLRFLIPNGARVLELGCGTGHLLAGLKPSHGVGVDISERMVEVAKSSHPGLTFIAGDTEDPEFVRSLPGPFDFIVIVDTIGSLDDCQKAIENLQPLCAGHTRLVIGYYSHLWHPLLKLAEFVRLRMRQPPQNILAPEDVKALTTLAGFEPFKSESRLLSPFRLWGIGRFANRFLAPLPLVRALCFRHYTVARLVNTGFEPPKSATIVIPARNEKGNIEPAVKRMPRFADNLEIIFVEGHSTDGTWEEIQRVKAAYPDIDIKALRQSGKGKADAVFLGFDRARGDVLMILDADLTMPPEQLPKFWQVIANRQGEFINGSRLMYPMEDEAMRFLNLIANKAFAYLFSWLLNQRLTDTLCGTKVIGRSDYRRLKQGRAYFGDFDPFGDFDLIFGASKLNLKIVEVPIRYAARSYGTTQISRFRHGIILARMVVYAFFRIKAL
jgi:SAM-dependent methyltransferase